jgi:WD40 repeat protein
MSQPQDREVHWWANQPTDHETVPADAPQAQDECARSPADLPRQIGRFLIRARVGAGAFGTVYRAFDPDLEREVALKVAHPRTLNTPLRIERFLGDAKAAARLRHPNIVPVYDVGRHGELFFFASAYIQGSTLAEALDRGPLDVRRTATIVRDLAEALAYAHDNHVVHRDVKPDNVVLDDKGCPHLIDFGLARRHALPDASTEGVPHSTGEAFRTQDGAVLGTPAYMSPEQWSGHSAEARAASDQYSLGVTLYELLCGQPPFSGTLPILRYAHLNLPPAAPRSLRDLPLDLEVICLKALAKRPRDRYPGCRLLAEDLRRWLDGEPIRARHMGLGERLARWCKREPRLVGALGIVFLSLLAIALLLAVGLRRLGEKHQLAETARARAESAQEAAEQAGKNETTAKRQAETEARRARKSEDVAKHAKNLAEQRKNDAEEAERQAKLDRKAAIKAKKRVDALLRQSHREQYYTLTGLAERELRDNQIARAVRLLALCPPEIPPGWEYHHLRHECRRLRQRDDHLWNLAFRPGNDWLAWGNGTKVILRHTSSRARRTFNAGGQVRCLSFAPDGASLAAGYEDGSVRVWELDFKRKPLGPPKLVHHYKHKGRVNRVSFSPRGDRLVSGGADRSVLLTEIRGGKATKAVLVHSLHRAEIRSVAFAPDGTKIVSACGSPWLCVTGLDGSKQLRLKSFTAGVFHPRGKYRIVAPESSAVTVYDHKNQEVCRFREHLADVLALTATSKDQVCSLDESGVIKVWQVTRIGPVDLFSCKTTGGFAFSEGPRGYALAWVDEDRTVRVRLPLRFGTLAYKLDSGENAGAPSDAPTLDDYSAYVHTLAYCPAENPKPGPSGYLLTAASIGSDQKDVTEGGEMCVWDVASGRRMARWENTGAPIWAVACSGSGPKALLAWGGKDKKIRMWTVAEAIAHSRVLPKKRGKDKKPTDKKPRNKDKEPRLLPADTGINALAFSPDGKALVCGGADGSVKVWDHAAETHRPLPKHDAEVTAVAFSPGGELLASADNKGYIRVWTARTWELRFEHRPHKQAIHGIAFSPDGKQLATASEDRTIMVCKGADDEPEWLPRLDGHTSAVTGVAFSPDGKRLASCSRDKSVRLWEPATGREALSLQGRTGLRQGIAFRPDGRQLAVASVQGVRRWEADLPRK